MKAADVPERQARASKAPRGYDLKSATVDEVFRSSVLEPLTGCREIWEGRRDDGVPIAAFVLAGLSIELEGIRRRRSRACRNVRLAWAGHGNTSYATSE